MEKSYHLVKNTGIKVEETFTFRVYTTKALLLEQILEGSDYWHPSLEPVVSFKQGLLANVDNYFELKAQPKLDGIEVYCCGDDNVTPFGVQITGITFSLLVKGETALKLCLEKVKLNASVVSPTGHKYHQVYKIDADTPNTISAHCWPDSADELKIVITVTKLSKAEFRETTKAVPVASPSAQPSSDISKYTELSEITNVVPDPSASPSSEISDYSENNENSEVDIVAGPPCVLDDTEIKETSDAPLGQAPLCVPDCAGIKENVKAVPAAPAEAVQIRYGNPVSECISDSEGNQHLDLMPFPAWLVLSVEGQSDFKFSLSNADSDFIIIHGLQTYAVHSFVLMKEAPDFLKKCIERMEATKGRYVSFKTPKIPEMLRYLYTGKVQNLQDIHIQLYKLADKYRIYGLKTLCICSLLEGVCKSNAFEMYHFGKEMGILSLVEKAEILVNKYSVESCLEVDRKQADGCVLT